VSQSLLFRVTLAPLLVAAVQVATTIASQYQILFPYAVIAITNWFQWVNLSLFSLISLGCKAQIINQFDQLVILTLLPLSIVGVCTVIYLFLKLPCVSEVNRIRFGRIPFLIILMTCFLCYSTVSATIVKSFRCIEFEDGEHLLAAGSSHDSLTVSWHTTPTTFE
jgi:hypothetical protein